MWFGEHLLHSTLCVKHLEGSIGNWWSHTVRVERILECCSRGNQDSPSRLVARGRIHGQTQEPHHVSGEHGGNSKSRTTRIELVERNCFEEICWVDERRIDGGDCQLEAQRHLKAVEAKKRKRQEAIEKGPTMKYVRMSDEGLDGLDGWLSVVVKVSGHALRSGKNSGVQNDVTDPVTLKVLSWSVAGPSQDSTDIFLSQISTLTDWDVLLLQECFRKLDGVNVGAHEPLTPSELVRRLPCPAVIIHQRWNTQSRAVGRASRWTAVELGGQLTTISAHLSHKGNQLGDFETVLAYVQDFMRRETGTTPWVETSMRVFTD